MEEVADNGNEYRVTRKANNEVSKTVETKKNYYWEAIPLCQSWIKKAKRLTQLPS